MIEKSIHQEKYSLDFIEFLYKWRKVLLIITVVAIAASLLFSSPLFITPKYKSTVILFPASTNSISKVLLSERSGSDEDILGFGEEEQAEQMLQILNSNKIRDKIISKYDLLNHYGIDPESKYKHTRLVREYKGNINFRRTEYLAVQIKVLDKDPVYAAMIANDIAELLDSTKNDMQKQRAKRGFEIVQQEYNELKSEVRGIVDSLETLGKIGVNDFEGQSEVLNQQLAIALAAGNQQGVRRIQERLDVLGKYGGAYLSLKNELEFKTEQLTDLKAKYKEAKVDAEQYLPQKFVVNSAEVAERKSYPVRWLIVVVSTLSAMILGVLFLALFENIRKIKIHKN